MSRPERLPWSLADHKLGTAARPRIMDTKACGRRGLDGQQRKIAPVVILSLFYRYDGPTTVALRTQSLSLSESCS